MASVVLERTFVRPRERRYGQSHQSGPGGFWRRLFEAMIAAREAKARRMVNSHLRTLDDAVLQRLGYERTALKREAARSWLF